MTFDELITQPSPHVEAKFPWRMQRLGKFWMITKIESIPEPKTNTTTVKYEMFIEGSLNDSPSRQWSLG